MDLTNSQLLQSVPQSDKPENLQKASRNFIFTRAIKIILALLCILGLIGGAYYLGAKQQRSTSLITNNKTNVSSLQILSPTLNPTENWKTYTSNTFGVSIKYPSDWGYDESSYQSVAFGPGNYKIPQQTEARPPVAITFFKDDYSVIVKDYEDTYGKSNEIPFYAGGLQGIYIAGTITAVGPGQGQSGGLFILNKDGKALVLGYSVNQGVSYLKTAKQMAQTITLSSQTASWKTYRSTPVGLTFSYPPQLQVQENEGKVSINNGTILAYILTGKDKYFGCAVPQNACPQGASIVINGVQVFRYVGTENSVGGKNLLEYEFIGVNPTNPLVTSDNTYALYFEYHGNVNDTNMVALFNTIAGTIHYKYGEPPGPGGN